MQLRETHCLFQILLLDKMMKIVCITMMGLVAAATATSPAGPSYPVAYGEFWVTFALNEDNYIEISRFCRYQIR